MERGSAPQNKGKQEMTIDQARNDSTRLMNITDMLAIASGSDSVMTDFGENRNVMNLLAAYYGGFNVGGDTSSFDRIRSNA